ncbi:hypothetical protein SS50377_26208 [Spironucleus salmonicida]|uniref:Uncharacterized protein n=1 Tax=Spironucleus salmonicida TaxID=348837 RepID=V6LQ06_9EUKA|nr:hypothetical protein SS50377_26208 [Spironucleus salmonicida]|eukprot:EST42844.1 Hypothetical protein SS50377_17530 [Spironucleus salmonicida]
MGQICSKPQVQDDKMEEEPDCKFGQETQQQTIDVLVHYRHASSIVKSSTISRASSTRRQAGYSIVGNSVSGI